MLFPILGLIPVRWRHTAGIGFVQGNYRLRERALWARSHRACGRVAASQSTSCKGLLLKTLLPWALVCHSNLKSLFWGNTLNETLCHAS